MRYSMAVALTAIYTLISRLMPKAWFEPDAESKKWLQDARESKRMEARALTNAVEVNLLPRLGLDLEAVIRDHKWSPMAVFLAIDSVSLSLSNGIRCISFENQADTHVTITEDGEVRIGTSILEPRVLQTEIRAFMDSVKLCDEEESVLLLHWIIQAAREVPDLFLDWDSKPDENGGVRLTILERSRRNVVKYGDLWKPTR